MSKILLRLSLFLSLGLYLCAPTAATPKMKPEFKSLMINLTNALLCPQNEESTMYCEAHTVYRTKDYAMVLASIQPTSGLFVVYKHSPKSKNNKTWKSLGSYSLGFYKETLPEAKLPKKIETYFMKQLDERRAKQKARRKRR